MARFLLLIPVLAIVAAASACGGSSGSGSVSVPKADVAIVGDRVITVDQLDREIQLRVSSAKVDGQTLPKAGTDAFRTQVVQPLIGQLVLNAQIENIAQKLGVTASDSDMQKALEQGIQQNFGGDQAKFQAYLNKYGISEDELKQLLIRPRVLGQKIQDKLTSQVKVSDKDVQAYYDQNKAQFDSKDSREVMFLLAPSKANAEAARKALAGGADWTATAKKYAIPPGPPSYGGTFTASKGAVETNFGNAVFGNLKTDQLSALIPVSQQYEQSSLAGKCKPQCYFLVKPTADVKKGGHKSFDQVKAQIRLQLEQQKRSSYVQLQVQKLLAEQKALTHYAAAYVPPVTPTPSSGGSTGP